MKAGHSPYLQQGMQRLQCLMPAAMINSESKERERRRRQPVSASIRRQVNSSSGQGSAACNSSPSLCWWLHSPSHEVADPDGVTEGELCQHGGAVKDFVEGQPPACTGFKGGMCPHVLCGE